MAQSITTGAFSPGSACAGGTVSITYAVSASFATGNTFSAQLSDATGVFPSKPIVIGTLASVTSGTINATIPASTGAGSGYRVRVVANTPSVAGSISSAALTVNVPLSPGIATPVTYCEGVTASALTATSSTGGTLVWYGTSKTGGMGSTTATQPNTNLVGNTVYYVSQVVGTCESDRAAITVSVTGRPVAPGATSLSYCVGQTAGSLTATPLPGAVLTWYTSLTGGTGSSISPTPSTKTAGATTYYVSQKTGSCESARASLVVTVNAPPATPTATAPAPYCSGSPAAALTASGQNLKWYGAAATGGTGSSVATIPNTAVAGTTNYYVSQLVGTCESPRTSITVVVNASPAAPATGPAPAYCQNQAVVSLTASPAAGGILNWYGNGRKRRNRISHSHDARYQPVRNDQLLR